MRERGASAHYESRRHARAAGVSAALCALAVGAAGCGAGRRAPQGDTPAALLAGAIDRAGGARALERATALVWEGDAVVTAGARTVRIAGRWIVQPPDSAVVATYDVSRGPTSERALVVAAPRGWLAAGGRFTPMPDALLASERDEFYLYQVMRLVPLRAPAVTLTPVAPDSLGQRGFRADQAGRPPVTLYVDGDGRLAHLAVDVRDAGGGGRVRQDVWLSGAIEADGVRWPRQIRLTMDGAPYFALTLRTLRTAARADDARLLGPPPNDARPALPPPTRLPR